MKTTTTASLLTALLAAGVTATPGIFDDIHSDFDSAKTRVEDAWSSATASTTTTTSSSSSTSTSTSTTATATAYPGCTSSSSNSWCGVVIAAQTDNNNTKSDDNTPAKFNVSITDSKCNQVASHTNVEEGHSVTLDSAVGTWEFGVYNHSDGTAGLNLTYEGRNVSDFQKWQGWGVEYLNYTEGRVMLYGGITNCTSADKEKSSSSSDSDKKDTKSDDKDNAAGRVYSAGWALASVFLAMATLL
ncbi:hypothetical protein M406DRAFT_72657 [Cryphonectria parasitica EP155]|uniref:Uncharacterized protein n=1 Tax=Cryphonectria parasitica (strain ATCC 38755 / EP155) TaxID=660469 RepID=A0A9P4XX81_CRYP1|nr:uncharacterized protein M406DRAFT_72657 [Cryphonectria parasitica EP155]KAF3762673.1 hypothetical protein M406DRAFT_72657 [Cryphonectria parasitica EP155]